MKWPRRAALISLLVIAAPTVIAISRANFFLLPFASINEDGAESSGYVYANSYRPSRVTYLLVTRLESGQKHSYLATVQQDDGGPTVMDCNDWKAPHAPLFIFPDFNMPCIHWYAADETSPQLKTPKRDVIVGNRSLEFTANDGKRVTIRW